MSTHEREITAPSPLVDERGELRRDAIGWSRTPLHGCALREHPGRKKRWSYWAVQDESLFFALTFADVDYLGLATASFVRPHEGRRRRLVERIAVTPLGRRIELPLEVESGRAAFDGLGLHVAADDEGDRVRLAARFTSLRGEKLEAEIVVHRPPGSESVNVVVPWSERRYQYTSKQVALPAVGWVRVDGETFAFGDRAFGCLDFGRGVWPYRTTWNWGAASGVVAGRTIGVNLGGQWTRGTGMTENGVVVDGRTHKIGDEVSFSFDRARMQDPWRVRDDRGERVNLTFTPDHTRHVRVGGRLLGSELRHALGTYAGELALDGGERLRVDGLRGWAEEHQARW